MKSLKSLVKQLLLNAAQSNPFPLHAEHKKVSKIELHIMTSLEVLRFISCFIHSFIHSTPTHQYQTTRIWILFSYEWNQTIHIKIIHSTQYLLFLHIIERKSPFIGMIQRGFKYERTKTENSTFSLFVFLWCSVEHFITDSHKCIKIAVIWFFPNFSTRNHFFPEVENHIEFTYFWNANNRKCNYSIKSNKLTKWIQPLRGKFQWT